MRKTHLVAAIALPAIIVLLVFVPRALLKSAPPRVNFYDLPGYRRALNQSNDPASKAIRQQIADGPAALARERALAKHEGLPIVAADLQQPLPPPDQNAAPVYDQIAAHEMASGPRFPMYADSMSAHYAYTPEQIAIVQKIYDTHSETFRLLHLATDKPQCVFTHDFSKTISTLFPIFQSQRNDARMLRTESHLLTIQGKYHEAVTNQVRGFHLAQHTASFPTLVSYLIGLAINSTAYSGMQDILESTPPNVEIATLVQKNTVGSAANLSLRHAFSGEIAMTDTEIESLHHATPLEIAKFFSNSDDPFANNSIKNAAFFAPQDQLFVDNLLDAAEADYIHQMRQIISAASLPALPRRAAFAKLALRYPSGADNPARIISESINPVRVLDSLMLSSMGTMDQQDTRNHAREEIILAGAEVLKQKALTGVFPNKLPAGFTDPFSNKPLGYRLEGTVGFVVYSVGADGTFDGGTSGGKTQNQILFRYPLVQIPVPQEDLGT